LNNVSFPFRKELQSLLFEYAQRPNFSVLCHYPSIYTTTALYRNIITNLMHTLSIQLCVTSLAITHIQKTQTTESELSTSTVWCPRFALLRNNSTNRIHSFHIRLTSENIQMCKHSQFFTQ
jgi:hypothetical protein